MTIRREENEVSLEMIPLDSVLYHPMSVILERLAYIAKDQHIILACPGRVICHPAVDVVVVVVLPNQIQALLAANILKTDHNRNRHFLAGKKINAYIEINRQGCEGSKILQG